MPIVQFHLVEGAYSDEAIADLLTEASRAYVRVLYPTVSPSPIERVRAFVAFCAPQYWATAGNLVSQGGTPAPYFTCLAFSGRPQEQLDALMSAFTDLIEQHCECERSLVRGQVISIDPAHWSIGGTAASTVRGSETALRAAGLASGEKMRSNI
jgi:phenylpyruvate tautomerase PptA (4-oxalocrotonate tautomerase family)